MAVPLNRAGWKDARRRLGSVGRRRARHELDVRAPLEQVPPAMATMAMAATKRHLVSRDGALPTSSTAPNNEAFYPPEGEPGDRHRELAHIDAHHPDSDFALKAAQRYRRA